MEAYELHCGQLGSETSLVNHLENVKHPDYPGDIPETGDGDTVRDWYKKMVAYSDRLQKESRERMIAMMFLKGACRIRYGSLWFNLQN